MRLFAAIRPPAELQARLEKEARARIPLEQARWSPAGNLHVTLHFFGATPEDRVPAIREALEKAAAVTEPFDVRLEGAGTFPGAVWLGVARESGASLAFLQRLLAGELRARGFAVENRPYRPHLTVARLKGRQSPRVPASPLGPDAVWASWRASSLSLMESRTLPEGAVYSEILSVPLATAGK